MKGGTVLGAVGGAVVVLIISSFMLSPPSLLLRVLLAALVVPLVLVGLLIKLPRPVPDRWEVRLFLLMGMPASQFLRLVIQNGVDPVFWHRALYGTYISVMNSLFWIPKEDEAFPPSLIHALPHPKAPVFILGHYRSGTSLLHELMNRDPDMVAPTVFQCYTPRIFLGREGFVQRQFRHVRVQRPMDRMQISLDSAFEDEFALANLCGLSPYLGAIFPRQYNHYQRYLAMEGCDEEEVAEWKTAVVFFYKKLLLRHQGKRLVLKSPSHTARVSLLLELFPDARFVHLSRHPYDLYQSTHKLHQKLLLQWCLQRPPLEDKAWRRSIILNHLSRMYEALFRDSASLRPDQLVEVRYEDLVADPIATVQHIYQQLRLPGFHDNHMADRLNDYYTTTTTTSSSSNRGDDPTKHQQEQGPKTEAAAAGGPPPASSSSFKVNSHGPLSEEDKKAVAEAWGEYFQRYGYHK